MPRGVKVPEICYFQADNEAKLYWTDNKEKPYFTEEEYENNQSKTISN